MNNQEAKQILSAYRPGGEDASDPAFEEALEQARRDPELAAWFRQERARDAALAEIFQALPVPRGGKASLLSLPRNGAVKKRKRFAARPWLWGGLLAASLAILVGVGSLLVVNDSPAPRIALSESRSLGPAELLHMAHDAMPLDFQSDSLGELRAWLAGRNVPEPANLPRGMASLGGVGCRVFEDEGGNPISLLCLEKDGELVHLFVAEGQVRDALAVKEGNWAHEGNWNVYSWSDAHRSYVLMSRAPREELEALLI